jgi:hypothetical protein
MLRHLALVPILALAGIAQPAFAQAPAASEPASPVELFGGLSFLPADGDDFPRTDSTGFQVGAAFYLNRWFAVFGEIGGHYSHADDLGPNFVGVTADSSVYEYLFGPRFVGRRGRTAIFAHGLVGSSTGRTDIGFSDSGFTLGGGGGVDVDITPRLAVRGQFDLIGSFADIVEGNPRAAVGVVFRP